MPWSSPWQSLPAAMGATLLLRMTVSLQRASHSCTARHIPFPDMQKGSQPCVSWQSNVAMSLPSNILRRTKAILSMNAQTLSPKLRQEESAHGISGRLRSCKPLVMKPSSICGGWSPTLLLNAAFRVLMIMAEVGLPFVGHSHHLPGIPHQVRVDDRAADPAASWNLRLATYNVTALCNAADVECLDAGFHKAWPTCRGHSARSPPPCATPALHPKEMGCQLWVHKQLAPVNSVLGRDTLHADKAVLAHASPRILAVTLKAGATSLGSL